MNHGTIVGIFWGTAFGLLVGLVPLIPGMKKNQPALGIGGFFACIVSGAILGLILAIPCCAFFWWRIKKADNKSDEYKD